MSAAYLRRCAGKRRHEDRHGADTEKTVMVMRKGVSRDRISVYRCDQCLGWHVGGAAHAFISRKRRSGKRPNKRLRGRV